MAIKKPIDEVDFMLTGRGDPNAANAPYDPILQNLYTPAPIEIPVNMPAPNKPVRTMPIEQKPLVQETKPAQPKPSLSMSSTQKTRPNLDWGQVDKLSTEAKTTAKTGAEKMAEAAKIFKERKKVETPVPEYEKSLAPLEKETEEFTKVAVKNVEDINKQVEKVGGQLNILQEKEKEVTDNYKSKVDPFERDMEELLKAPPELKEIDQGRLWRNASTGNKIGLAISLIFAALTPEGIKNAVNSINDAINRDVDAQKQDNIYVRDQWKERITGSKNLVTYYLNKYQDDRSAIAASRTALLTGAMNMLNMSAMGLNNRKAILNAQQGFAQLMNSAIKNKDDAVINRREMAEKEARTDFETTAAGVKSINDAASMTMDAAKLKEQELYHRSQLDLLKKELSIKAAKDVPAVFSTAKGDDKYAAAIDARIPPGGENKERNKETHKQLGIVREQYLVKKAVRDFFSQVVEMGPSGAFNRFSSDTELINNARAVLFPTMKSIMGERFTDADAKTLVDPFLPSRFTPNEQLAVRLRTIENMLGTKVGETSYFDTLGLRKNMDAEFERDYNVYRELMQKRVK